MSFTRFAIYFTPSAPALAKAGAHWLGWNLKNGTSTPSPVPEVTARPRKYGFHATIKPPCRLAPGYSLDDVDAALFALCADLSLISLDALRLSRIGSFLALAPIGNTSELDRMAAQVVRNMDGFRATPTEAELQRRITPKTTREELENIKKWGYPYVMGCFRFHITLTGPQKPQMLDQVESLAQEHFNRLLPQPFPIDGLSLVGEQTDGTFVQISRHGFGAKS